jgi:uncharacterized membrane protein
MKRTILTAILAMSIPLASVNSEAWGQTYSFRTIDLPGAALTAANANNGDGHILGVYDLTDLADNNPVGFLLSNGTFRTIAFPGSTGTLAAGINLSQLVVGSYFNSHGIQHGFMLKSGVYSTLDYPGAASTSASFINDSDTVIGVYFDGSRYHGFHLEGTTFKTIDFPGAAATFPGTINNAGEIVGAYTVTSSSPLRGYLQNGHVYTEVDFPAAASTSVNGINRHGDIVGDYVDARGVIHGFTLIGGVYKTIDFPGASGTIANEINDHGQIVGDYTGPYGSSDSHGFLATPLLAPAVALRVKALNQSPN